MGRHHSTGTQSVEIRRDTDMVYPHHEFDIVDVFYEIIESLAPFLAGVLSLAVWKFVFSVSMPEKFLL